ncbi:MAG: SIMPL domain-containing protein [Jaaginema sp. PMC 1079.18]|nr:SIMPL domain-containing protein [Jaaginema sp. PMC 1080.18]MEC4851089.1 SIMPL domain-containing protein [Jaaginema sp. PMC 1079.18]MEC4867037.1 SIMPL domain-containing protein [Jaaginema sp. PMC 1078.18]
MNTLLSRPKLTLATAFSLLSLALPVPAIAQDIHTLTVTGQGEVAVPTTIARISLGIEAQGNNAEQVQQEVARRTTAVLALLQQRNVAQLQTTGVQLQPQYSYRDDERRLLGYLATNSIAFRIATPQAGALIDATLKAGATKIDGVNFLATEDAIATASQEALRLATQDALDQADIVLEYLNLSRQEVSRININNANTSPPRLLQNAAFAGEDALKTQLVGGDMTVNANVTLEIEY